MSLAHGEFEAMVREDLPFKPSTAQYLMRIARHPVLSNAHHGGHLPDSWRTLAELARVPEETLIRAVDEDRIARHPVLSNPAHVRDLPGSWGTLAELARVPA